MLRSLFTAISGLGVHQQMLDVTANNIANVNTTGYKSATVEFEDTLSQTLGGGSPGALGGPGGTDPVQVGLGVRFAGTQNDFTQGSTEATGVTSNMLVNGDGFFVIQKDGQTMYTRAGDFNLDSAGNLVTPDGGVVCDANGSPLDLSGLTNGTYSSWSVASDGTIYGVDSSGTTTQLGQVGLATFSNPNGLMKAGDTDFQATPASGPANIGGANSGSRGSISSGYVEMSNVDLSHELTNLIIAERGFQANSKVITTSDEVLQTLVNLKQ